MNVHPTIMMMMMMMKKMIIEIEFFFVVLLFSLVLVFDNHHLDISFDIVCFSSYQLLFFYMNLNE
jgi:hypothetical protein